MSKEKNIEDVIKENAGNPKSAEVDGQRVEQHSLSELIKADAYLAKKKAARRTGCGVKFAKMEHSGSC